MPFQGAGSWGASHYAMTNYEEYFAEGVSSSTVHTIFKESEKTVTTCIVLKAWH